MNKKFLIILGAQTVLIVLLVVFSLFQRAEAERQRDLANQQREITEHQRLRLEMALREAELARTQLKLTLESLARRDN